MRCPRLFRILAFCALAATCIAFSNPGPSLAALRVFRADAATAQPDITTIPAPTPTETPSATVSPVPVATSTPAQTTPYPLPAGGPPSQGGTVILVSLGQQWLWAYQDHRLVFNTPVTTGRPGMETPTGTFTVLFHREDMDFTGWNPPEHVYYGLYFHDYGYYIHDATWRQDFGPGTNMPHLDAAGKEETGSHGCVEVPLAASKWLYQWAQDRLTLVIIVAGPPQPVPAPQPPAPAPTPPQPAFPVPIHRGSMIPE